MSNPEYFSLYREILATTNPPGIDVSKPAYVYFPDTIDIPFNDPTSILDVDNAAIFSVDVEESGIALAFMYLRSKESKLTYTSNNETTNSYAVLVPTEAAPILVPELHYRYIEDNYSDLMNQINCGDIAPTHSEVLTPVHALQIATGLQQARSNGAAVQYDL